MPATAHLPRTAQVRHRQAPNDMSCFFENSTPPINFSNRGNMRSALYRYLTFVKYFFPSINTPNTSQLAESGLFLSAEGTVECQYCFHFSIPISQFRDRFNGMAWSDYEKQHLEISPYCPLKHKNILNYPLNEIQYDWRYELVRLYTLLSATYENPLLWKSPPLKRCLDMAKEGFVYEGPDDKVRCAFCRLEISSWSEEDDVAEEHRNSNPLCPFITHTPSVGNVALGHEQVTGVGTDAVVFALPEDNGIRYGFPNFGNMQIRESSFMTPKWQHQEANLSGQRMANSGFFFTGLGDLVACYHCGIGVEGWGPDDSPREVHNRFSHLCDMNK